jgi:hypothetical protein
VIKKKEVFLSSRRRRIYYADLIENKFEAVAFKKCKMEKSSASDDNTQPLSKCCKKSLKAKGCSRGCERRHGRECKSFLILSFQTNE